MVFSFESKPTPRTVPFALVQVLDPFFFASCGILDFSFKTTIQRIWTNNCTVCWSVGFYEWNQLSEFSPYKQFYARHSDRLVKRTSQQRGAGVTREDGKNYFRGLKKEIEEKTLRERRGSRRFR